MLHKVTKRYILYAERRCFFMSIGEKIKLARQEKAPRKELFYYFKTAFKKNPAKPLHTAVIIDVTIKL